MLLVAATRDVRSRAILVGMERPRLDPRACGERLGSHFLPRN